MTRVRVLPLCVVALLLAACGDGRDGASTPTYIPGGSSGDAGTETSADPDVVDVAPEVPVGADADPGPSDEDAAAPPDAWPEEPPPCDPPCDEPDTECVDGACECIAGTHPGGGEAGCVPEGTCAEGYGIMEAGVCVPVADFCPDSDDECAEAVAWEEGACQYGPVPDGTPCEGTDGGPCVTEHRCEDGLCLEVWPPCVQGIRPIVFVHGYDGGTGNWEVMIQRLQEDGWPPEYLVPFQAEDPVWTCNVDNAAAIAALVEEVRQATCHDRVDLLAHSMGALSTRYYLKYLGGTEVVNTYVTLGGMHHGLFWSCLAPDILEVCVWQEICQWGDFVNALNDDPVTPGDLHWVSIYSLQDVVVPADSSHLEGAENIPFEGIIHDGPGGLLQDEDVYQEVLRVLDYPCW